MLIFDPNQKCRFILAEQTPVTDFQTKAPVTKDGKLLHRYTVLVLRQDGRPATIRVKAPATPTPLELGSPVVFQNLAGTLWERDGNLSIAFSAIAIAPVAQGVKP